MFISKGRTSVKCKVGAEIYLSKNHRKVSDLIEDGFTRVLTLNDSKPIITQDGRLDFLEIYVKSSEQYIIGKEAFLSLESALMSEKAENLNSALSQIFERNDVVAFCYRNSEEVLAKKLVY